MSNMAKLARYEVPPAPMPGAHEEWEQLLQTLHRSGTLRVLNGLFGQLGQVSDVALEGLDSGKGRNAISVLLGAVQVASHLDAQVNAKVARGVIQGAADGRGRTRPPGVWRILRLIFAADTRRAIGGLLLILNRVGGAMRREQR